MVLTHLNKFIVSLLTITKCYFYNNNYGFAKICGMKMYRCPCEYVFYEDLGIIQRPQRKPFPGIRPCCCHKSSEHKVI